MKTVKQLLKNAGRDFVTYWWVFAGVIGAMVLAAWLKEL
jgi:hypothetical protein